MTALGYTPLRDNSKIDWLKKWRFQLDDFEKEILQKTYDYFKKNQQWPHTRKLAIELREKGDVYAKVTDIGYPFINVTRHPSDKDSRIKLFIFGLAICENSEKDVEILIDFIKLCATKLINTPENPIISEKDLSHSISTINYIHEFYPGEILGSGTRNDDLGTFEYEIKYDALKYEKINNINDYIALNIDHIPTSFGGNYKRTPFDESSNDNTSDTTNEIISDSLNSKIEEKKNELALELKKHEEAYYDFSVFISHADLDYSSLHDLLLEMIKNKIKPVVWFRIIKDKSVREKLIEEIHKADIFLIYLSKKSVVSQLTNNEIGFVEGKKFYKKKKGDIVLRLFDKNNLTRDDCKGFYGLFDDGKSFDSKSASDRNEVVITLNEMWTTIEKTETSSGKVLEEDLKEGSPTKEIISFEKPNLEKGNRQSGGLIGLHIEVYIENLISEPIKNFILGVVVPEKFSIDRMHGKKTPIKGFFKKYFESKKDIIHHKIPGELLGNYFFNDSLQLIWTNYVPPLREFQIGFYLRGDNLELSIYYLRVYNLDLVNNKWDYDFGPSKEICKIY